MRLMTAVLRFFALVIACCLAVTGFARSPAGAAAAPFVFEVDMYGYNQVPPVNSIGWGFVRFFFSEDRHSADYTVDVKGFSGSLVSGADIHRGAPGTNGPVIHHLADGGFIVTSGRLQLSPAELDDMATGLWYVSVKTTLHPEGEMRGQIILPPNFLPGQAIASVELAPALLEPEAVAGVSPPQAAPPGPPAPAITPPNTGDAGLAGAEHEPLSGALVGLSAMIFGVGLLVVSGRI